MAQLERGPNLRLNVETGKYEPRPPAKHYHPKLPYVVVNGKKIFAEEDPDDGGKLKAAVVVPFDHDRDYSGDDYRRQLSAMKDQKRLQELEAEVRKAYMYEAEKPEGMEGGYRKKRYSKRTLKNRRRPNRKTKARRRRSLK